MLRRLYKIGWLPEIKGLGFTDVAFRVSRFREDYSILVSIFWEPPFKSMENTFRVLGFSTFFGGVEFTVLGFRVPAFRAWE